MISDYRKGKLMNNFLTCILIIFSVFFSFNRGLSRAEEKKVLLDSQKSEKRSSDGRYIDKGDGTIVDSSTGLMWVKKDSYADLGMCLNWNQAKEYVSQLRMGGYNDWRLPTVEELKSILEKSKKTYSGISIFIKTVYIDPIFAKGSAPECWSSETDGSCCARYVRFGKSPSAVGAGQVTYCGLAGARAVRHP